MENMGNNEHLTQHQVRNTGNVYLAGEITFCDSGCSRKMHFLLMVLSGLILMSARWCYNYSHAKQIWETPISLYLVNRKLKRPPASLTEMIPCDFINTTTY